jgi:hypothetical protein
MIGPLVTSSECGGRNNRTYPSAVMGILLKLNGFLVVRDSMISRSVATSFASTLSQTVATVPSGLSE